MTLIYRLVSYVNCNILTVEEGDSKEGYMTWEIYNSTDANSYIQTRSVSIFSNLWYQQARVY